MVQTKVIIADDDKLTRIVLRRYMEMAGITVLDAENGKVALNLLHDHPDIDCIVLDLDMPVMSGYDFLEHMNSTSANSIEVFIASCSPQWDFIKTSRDRNLVLPKSLKYFEKPFNMMELTSHILNAKQPIRE